MEWDDGTYKISTDQSLISLEKVCGWLAKSYWASHRSVETIKKSIENSLCFGVYHEGEQIGFARVITDYATMYWLGDVIIDEQFRGKGIGKDLVRCIVEYQEINDLRGVLATSDAHDLYRKFGFEVVDGIYMRRERR